MFDDLLKHRSGRVIALARIVLAAVFLSAIWIDPKQPVQAAAESYALLGLYVAGSVAVAALTWSNWWLDARLAGPAHIADIGLFGLLVLASDGYTSPFFVFFVYLLLSAAIRWGWRQTAQTAVAVITLFFAIGLVTSNPAEPDFDLQRFIIRSANLMILSALLIWFGVTHGFSLGSIGDELLRDPKPDDDPLETALEAAARLAGASSAMLVWEEGSQGRRLVEFAGGIAASDELTDWTGVFPASAFLFDTGLNRALCRGPSRALCFPPADSLIDRRLGGRLRVAEGLGVPVGTDSGRGLLVLGGVRSLCTDHIDFGEKLGPAIARHIQRHSLLSAVRERAIARARLSLARDLHDSIVQFLAGATFRVEAISRGLRSGDRPDAELADLKLLLLQEQQELRSAIGALRSDRIELATLASDLESSCGRIARQWDIVCTFFADLPEGTVPMRLHLDTHQLVREAVANAVRHAGAKYVSVSLGVEGNDLRLEISNDGRGSERLQEGEPWSLRERVDESGGTLMLATGKDGTSVSITLPMNGESRP